MAELVFPKRLHFQEGVTRHGGVCVIGPILPIRSLLISQPMTAVLQASCAVLHEILQCALILCKGSIRPEPLADKTFVDR
jgi:hypothetical protein